MQSNPIHSPLAGRERGAILGAIGSRGYALVSQGDADREGFEQEFQGQTQWAVQAILV